MADESRKVAIAIGVADAKPLKYLGGAVNSARGFHAWATALGYESTLVTDEDKLVTMADLKAAMEAVLLRPNAPPISRLIVFFAGHGLIRGAEEGLWLLSDWKKDLRAVATEVLRRRLYKYKVAQVAIFADACRSLPPDIDDADLTADGVLGDGPGARTIPPIDKFIAAQDGTETYMIPGNNPEDDRCIFSGVLLEGLWGTKQSAFSKLRKTQITSQSLGTYLKAEVPQLAAKYKFKLDPTVSFGFPEGDDVYFGDGVPPPPPVFPEWPPLKAVTRMGPGKAKAFPEDFSAHQPSPGFRGCACAACAGCAPLPSEPREARRVMPKPQSEATRRKADEKRKKAEAAFLARVREQSRPKTYETHCGFAISGKTIRTIWSGGAITAEQHKKPGWWRIGEPAPQGGTTADPLPLSRPAPVLMEFDDGALFAAPTALPNFIATVLCDQRGVSALIYRRAAAPDEQAAMAEEVLARMESGPLRADAATDFAVVLRKFKHTDPVLGVVSAYLYDSIGDIDSIRRMASYYVQFGQPIPYDIALLGHLKGTLRDGLLWAELPAVGARKPRTDAEAQFAWTHVATPAGAGVVGGWWPWMRQGWSYLDDPAADGSTLVLPGLPELSEELTPARFATLSTKGAKQLAKLFDLTAKPEARRARVTARPR